MKRALPAIALAVGLLWTASLAAQGRNFSGSWTVDTERMAAMAAESPATMVAAGGGGGGVGVARGGGGAATGAVATTGGGGGGFVAAGGGGRGGGGGGARGGPAGPMTITIDAGSFSLGQGTATTVYKLDGSTTTTQGPRGDITSKAAWKDDKLVIETTNQGPNGPLVTTTTWYLDGASLVREVASTTLDGQVVTRKTFFKKS